MNVYGIVPTDLNSRLSPQRRIELTDSETAPTGTENTATTQATIDSAVVRFHGAAGKYYAVPIAPRGDATIAEATDLTALVKRIVIAIAAYDLMALKPEWLNNGSEAGYWLALNSSNEKTLAGLASKDRGFVLPAALERAVPTSTSGGASMLSDTSLFSRDTMSRY